MKLRVRYTKMGKIRFTSHRDTARHWERAVRKAGIPLAYSAGFTPRPKMSFGLALPTGGESLAEYLDMDLAPIDPERGQQPDLEELRGRFDSCLPVGYETTAVVAREPGCPSLQEDVVACTWLLSLSGVGAQQAEQAVGAALEQSSLLVERERKGQRSVDDVRAAIESLQVTSVAEDPRPHLCAVLATNGRGLRPTELVGALFPTLDPIDLTGRVLRTHQWIERDGERRDIVPTPAVATRTPVECA